MKLKSKNVSDAKLVMTMSSKKSVPILRNPTHNEVSACASALWERSGKPQDRDVAIWLEAERHLRSGALMAEAADDASADTMVLLGEPGGTLENSLQAFGDQSGARSATSL
jgi:LmbE family N-acetylglucosaminyl deacetylase